MFEAAYDPERDTLFVSQNAGLFSNLSVTLWALIELFNDGIDPAHLAFAPGFTYYRDDHLTGPDAGLHSRLFRRVDHRAVAELRSANHGPVRRHDHHGLYLSYPFAALSAFMRGYFALSDEVKTRQAEFIERYRILPAKTIAVVYRGTDKQSEVSVAAPERFLAVTDELLRRQPTSRVWIQTDQEQVRTAFHDAFGPRCLSLREMPTTTSELVLHLDPTVHRGSRTQFAVDLVAVASLLGQCRSVVNHTGNMAAWISLFRGSASSMVQFDQFGHPWPAPDL